MLWSCSIRVVDDDGDGVEGAEVTLMGSVLGGYLSEYTDDGGWAEFEIESSHQDVWHWEYVAIDNEKMTGSLSIDDGETLSFAI